MTRKILNKCIYYYRFNMPNLVINYYYFFSSKDFIHNFIKTKEKQNRLNIMENMLKVKEGG